MSYLEDVAKILGKYRGGQTLLHLDKAILRHQNQGRYSVNVHLIVPTYSLVKAGALEQVNNGGKGFPKQNHKLKQLRPKASLPVNDRGVMGKTCDDGRLHIVSLPDKPVVMEK